MPPSLWLGASAAVIGVVNMARAVAGQLGAAGEAGTDGGPTGVEGYSSRWIHEAFSAVDISEQMFEGPRTRSRIPRRFRRRERHIERLHALELRLVMWASTFMPFLVPKPGVWRLIFAPRDSFAAIYRTMRVERSLSTRAFIVIGAAAAVALFAARAAMMA